MGPRGKGLVITRVVVNKGLELALATGKRSGLGRCSPRGQPLLLRLRLRRSPPILCGWLSGMPLAMLLLHPVLLHSMLQAAATT